VIGRSGAGRGPEKPSIRFWNHNFIDAGFSTAHQSSVVEFPKFVAITAMPLASPISPLILKANCNSVVGERPQIFHKSVFELALPLSSKEASNRCSACDELAPISLHRVFGVRHRDALRVPGIPGILSKSNFSQCRD
jgi:hypothetical protein